MINMIESSDFSDSLIINYLENNTLRKQIVSVDAYETDLNLEIDDILLKVNKVILPSGLKYNHKQPKECLLKLKLINKKLQEIQDCLRRSAKQRPGYVYTCGTCAQNIDILPNISIWQSFQIHDHVEDKLAKLSFAKCYPLKPIGNVSSVNSYQNNALIIANKTISKSIDYSGKIQQLLYPKDLMGKFSDVRNGHYYILQCTNDLIYKCFLCNCEVRGKEKSLGYHLNCATHKQYGNNKNVLRIIQSYHDNWNRQEHIFQVHQVHFYPKTVTKAFCSLCLSDVRYDIVGEHLKSKKHKEGIKNLFCRKETIYLLKEQAQLYVKNRIEENDSTNRSENVSEVGETGTSGGDLLKRNEGNSQLEKLTCSDNEKKWGKNEKRKGHNITKSVTDPESKDLQFCLEKRLLTQLQVMRQNTDTVTCDCCRVDMIKEPHVIKMHIFSEAHKQKSKIKLIKVRFNCGICNLHFRAEDLWDHHLHGSSHQSRCNSIDVLRREMLTEYQCKPCKMIIFGDEISVKHHSNKKRFNVNKVLKLSNEVRLLFTSEKRIEEEASKLSAEAKEVSMAQNSLFLWCRALEKTLSVLYKDCRVYPFGSRISGIGNMESDLDVFVDTGDMYNGAHSQDAVMQKNIIKAATKLFRNNRVEFRSVRAIPTARTPIVCVYHISAEMTCDLSFRDGLSVENTKYIRLCIELQPIMQQLILMLKHWLGYCKLHKSITTYALSMMVIFYLQKCGHLLTVHALKKIGPESVLVIDGWECVSCEIPKEVLLPNVEPCTSTLKQLLKDFFQYYATFDYHNDVICPLLGFPIKKTVFNEKTGHDLPQEMHMYVNKLQKPEPEYFRADSEMCLQDPFDLSHNLTKACSSVNVVKFKKLCDLMTDYLL